ncbi:oxygen-independent coproporphyrinogen III oxidase [Coralloluteibacterium stylophorae]|uniref:Coproporphyrinogen-III oxidase n=1 Tax=Coralloluteibacterium stylophorae TaxID=1776034 RepID=A0A8J8AYE0_9GAMM|nr:oxygen-independent coproporphyrinogen III oxidase [Coralloluteibacterium stylophorae]MBS7455693.1 oxygen-independent coproporphyrinogen III oxidase [Coralloluteibacterium stylophorae]
MAAIAEDVASDAGIALPPTLLARYARPVPRYTSYPTAAQFSALHEATYARWLAAVPPGEAISLYLHVPYCAALCWYCGCRTQATRHHRERVSAYVDLLLREIDLVAERLGRRQPVSAIHFGGGTPNLMSQTELGRVLGRLAGRFDVRADAELAMEIDPRSLTAEFALALGIAGFTRISLGIQDFDPEVQALIHREQPYALVEQAVRWLRDAGIAGINFDLIHGLPGQTETSIRRTVALAAALRPERIAVYGYAHLPQRQRHQRLIPADRLPDTLLRHRLREAAHADLLDAGYLAVGMDHYALPGDALATQPLARNFQGYSSDRAATLIGLGASAIGQFAQGYAQNVAATPLWREALEHGRLPVARGHALDDDDRLRRTLIERLMCDFSAPLGALAAAAGRSADELVVDPAMLDQLIADGLAWRSGDWVGATPRGRPLVRSLCAVFDSRTGGSTRHAPGV